VTFRCSISVLIIPEGNSSALTQKLIGWLLDEIEQDPNPDWIETLEEDEA